MDTSSCGLVEFWTPMSRRIKSAWFFGEQTGFILTRRPDTVRAPDISFVPDARLPPLGPGDGYFPGPPDLAVAILSPSNHAAAMQRKVDQYFAAGTRLVWVIDSHKQTITVHAPRRASEILNENDALDGEDVIPGFRYEIAELFARVRRD